MAPNFNLSSCPGKKATDRNGRASVETVVSLSVVGLTLTIFGLVISAGDERAQSERSEAVAANASAGQSHEAMGFPSSSSSADDKSRTITRNGITVQTPPLLVPVVNLEEPATGNGDQGLGKVRPQGRQYSTTRKHRRHAARTQPRWWKTEYRIVGLAANRRLIANTQ